MFAYIVRRIALIPLTLFGIITLNFVIAQIAPGGPVEIMLAHLQGIDTSAGSQLSGLAEVHHAASVFTAASGGK